MTATTIKVPAALRDRLKAHAAAHERTLSGEIAALLDEAERRDRYAAVRAAMVANPPDAAYADEADEWASDRWS